MLKSKGNDLARRTFLARYQDRLPTCGDTVRGKTFIKEACVDRRYYDDGTASAAAPVQQATAAPVQQATAAPVAPQPAAQTSAPDLFGGLFDAPQPVQQTAPLAQAPMPTSASAPAPAPAPAPTADIWNAFDAPAPPAPPAEQLSAVPAFAPPPAAPRPATQQQPAPASAQPDLFGGLTIETPAAQPAAQLAPVEVSTSAPSRAALEEDFWSMPQAPRVPPQAQLQMPGMPGMQMPQQHMQMPGMQMPQQHMQMPGMQMPQQHMQMPGMQMPQQHMQMPGMQMPQQHMQMPGMQMPGMQMPGMQMPQQHVQIPGMQMSGAPPQMHAPAQAPQPAQPSAQVEEEPEEPDPFASFGALTGIPSKVTKKPETNGASTAPPPVDFVSNVSIQEPPAQPLAEIPTTTPVNAPSNGMSMEPPVAQPAAVPVNAMPMPMPMPVPTEKPANLGSMGFPLPASRPPEPATDAHQAMMFEDMKNHTAGDSFSFAPVDSPPHSVVDKPVQPPVAAAQPVAAQATAAATQYSADNPFAFF